MSTLTDLEAGGRILSVRSPSQTVVQLMPSSPGTRKRQQQARRAALSEGAKKRSRRENTKARKKARKELDAAERQLIRLEDRAARQQARLKLDADQARLIRMQVRHRARQREKTSEKRLAAGVAAGQLMLDKYEAEARLAQVLADYHNSQITDEERARDAAKLAARDAEVARLRAEREETRRCQEHTLALSGEAPCRCQWWLGGFKQHHISLKQWFRGRGYGFTRIVRDDAGTRHATISAAPACAAALTRARCTQDATSHRCRSSGGSGTGA